MVLNITKIEELIEVECEKDYFKLLIFFERNEIQYSMKITLLENKNEMINITLNDFSILSIIKNYKILKPTIIPLN